jgi:hypothetical protein
MFLLEVRKIPEAFFNQHPKVYNFTGNTFRFIT